MSAYRVINRNPTLESRLHYIDNPVFILGHPKSGTSLITALLDSHPELMVLPEESDFYGIIMPLVKFLNAHEEIKPEEKKRLLLKKIFEDTKIRNFFRGKVEKDISGNFDYSSFNTELFKKLIADFIKTDRINSKELFKDIITAFSICVYNNEQRSTVKYWVEKTPRHIYYLSGIQAEFPKAKFIFIYRDPRDNYVSYNKKKRKALTAADFAINWNNCFEIVEHIDEEKVLFIKYEELITKPSTVISEIVAFLGISLTDSLFHPTKLGFLWKGNSMFSEDKNTIDSSKLYRYRTIISNEDWCTIEVLCKGKMQKYGYPFDKDITLGMFFRSYYERMIIPINNFLSLIKRKMRSRIFKINTHLQYIISKK